MNLAAKCDPGCATNGGNCTAPFTCDCPAGLPGSSCQTGTYIDLLKCKMQSLNLLSYFGTFCIIALTFC